MPPTRSTPRSAAATSPPTPPTPWSCRTAWTASNRGSSARRTLLRFPHLPRCLTIIGGGLVSAAPRSQGSSVALLERLVLASFASPRGLTRGELEELTGLSRTVVAGVVASLATRGELTETLQPPAGGGPGGPPGRDPWARSAK